jgi:hypothetical protein
LLVKSQDGVITIPDEKDDFSKLKVGRFFQMSPVLFDGFGFE